ncbi:hypothetical protein [Amycolatopsis sp. NPDC051071]|uniref:hypothetical protein n=1 Tax=Amycolatopsis sp. NPDC051071 TaxID=3154637 RepID=UPI0034180F6E
MPGVRTVADPDPAAQANQNPPARDVRAGPGHHRSPSGSAAAPAACPAAHLAAAADARPAAAADGHPEAAEAVAAVEWVAESAGAADQAGRAAAGSSSGSPMRSATPFTQVAVSAFRRSA